MIEVIHAISKGTIATKRRGVLVVVLVECYPYEQPFGKKLKLTWEPIAFNDDNLGGTIQPHDDALVVMPR